MLDFDVFEKQDRDFLPIAGVTMVKEDVAGGGRRFMKITDGCGAAELFRLGKHDAELGWAIEADRRLSQHLRERPAELAFFGIQAEQGLIFWNGEEERLGLWKPLSPFAMVRELNHIVCFDGDLRPMLFKLSGVSYTSSGERRWQISTGGYDKAETRYDKGETLAAILRLHALRKERPLEMALHWGFDFSDAVYFHRGRWEESSARLSGYAAGDRQKRNWTEDLCRFLRQMDAGADGKQKVLRQILQRAISGPIPSSPPADLHAEEVAGPVVKDGVIFF